MNLEFLAVEALGHFPIDGELSTLPGEVDHNFKVATSDDVFALRLTPPSVDDGVFSFQEGLLEAVAGTTFLTPQLVETESGSPRAQLGGGWTARLFTWVEGESYTETGRPPELAARVGEFAGAVVTALAHFHHPNARRDLVWDLTKAAAKIRELAPGIVENDRKRLVREVADSVEQLELSDLPRQIVHNDLNDDNVLFDGGQVVGFIDVGDALESIRIAEAVVAATYLMLGQSDPVSVGVEALRGFARRVEVTKTEAEAVYDLIKARLALSVSLSAFRGPDNPYHLRSEELGWDLLERLGAGHGPGIAAEMSAALGHPMPIEYPNLEKRRSDLLGPSLALSYEEPLHIVRGAGPWLFDQRARSYLDCVNNIAHVGHGHPRVVEAASRQMSALNTNTRYLHPEVLEYGDRLAGTFPDSLEVVFFVNSGSEANELALRMARAATRRHGVICLEHGYHGNTSTLVDVSHYKFAGPGGEGERPWVTTLPGVDPYRNPRFSGPEAAANVSRAFDEATAGMAEPPAALIAETLGGVGGQVVPAEGVVEALHEKARGIGAVVIADEVQTGLGRVGSAFWSFDLYDVIPDIVTMGKPLGNGHPLGALITTRQIADSFDNGMEFFSSFGGNPVSAAVGNAVLDVLEAEELQQNALSVGSYLVQLLDELASTDQRIGDVRGRGLFVGIETVQDRETKKPDAQLAQSIVEFARRNGVLVSTDGPLGNVIKIKPPMVFSSANAERLVATLKEALAASS